LYSDIDAGIVLTARIVLIGEPLEEIIVANVVGIPDANGEEASKGKFVEGAELACAGEEIDDNSEAGRSAYTVVDMPDPEEPTGKTKGKADDAPRVTTPEYVRVDTGVPYVITLVAVDKPEGFEVSIGDELEECTGEGDVESARVSASIDAVSYAIGDVPAEATTGIT